MMESGLGGEAPQHADQDRRSVGYFCWRFAAKAKWRFRSGDFHQIFIRSHNVTWGGYCTVLISSFTQQGIILHPTRLTEAPFGVVQQKRVQTQMQAMFAITYYSSG